MVDITNPIFHDEAKAVAHLEASRWPDGPFCPYCGSLNVHRMAGKTQAGMFLCNDCRDKFSARVGSVMERSHIPVHKWLLAMHLMAASKKGMSSKQLQRMLGVSYKSAWFLSMRIREAMSPDAKAGPIGGHGKTIESDETFVGGKKKNVHRGKPEPKKHAVHALVERGGQIRAKHVADVTAKTLKKNLRELSDRKSKLRTDDSLANLSIGKGFADHKTVAHTLGEYVRGDAHTQTVESFFALLKRGVFGSFHSVSEQHLQRYVDEFCFRWNTRQSLGMDDSARAAELLKAIKGRRLTYRPTDEATQSSQTDA
jgi:transposase-like protein